MLIRLDCSGNLLTNLDLSANTRLRVLFCDDNKLTSLDLSRNAELSRVDCGGNPLREIIVADTNNLPKYFTYDGNPVIREP